METNAPYDDISWEIEFSACISGKITTSGPQGVDSDEAESRARQVVWEALINAGYTIDVIEYVQVNKES